MHRGLTLIGLILVLSGAVTVELPPLIEAAKARDWAGVEGLLEKGAQAAGWTGLPRPASQTGPQ